MKLIGRELTFSRYEEAPTWEGINNPTKFVNEGYDNLIARIRENLATDLEREIGVDGISFENIRVAREDVKTSPSNNKSIMSVMEKHVPVYADVIIRNNKGTLLKEMKDILLVKIPWLDSWGTYNINGIRKIIHFLFEESVGYTFDEDFTLKSSTRKASLEKFNLSVGKAGKRNLVEYMAGASFMRNTEIYKFKDYFIFFDDEVKTRIKRGLAQDLIKSYINMRGTCSQLDFRSKRDRETLTKLFELKSILSRVDTNNLYLAENINKFGTKYSKLDIARIGNLDPSTDKIKVFGFTWGDFYKEDQTFILRKSHDFSVKIPGEYRSKKFKKGDTLHLNEGEPLTKEDMSELALLGIEKIENYNLTFYIVGYSAKDLDTRDENDLSFTEKDLVITLSLYLNPFKGEAIDLDRNFSKKIRGFDYIFYGMILDTFYRSFDNIRKAYRSSNDNSTSLEGMVSTISTKILSMPDSIYNVLKSSNMLNHPDINNALDLACQINQVEYNRNLKRLSNSARYLYPEQYNKLDPVETPATAKIGQIGAFPLQSELEDGTPTSYYFKVTDGKPDFKHVHKLKDGEEYNYTVTSIMDFMQAYHRMMNVEKNPNYYYDTNNYDPTGFVKARVPIKDATEVLLVALEEVDYISVSAESSLSWGSYMIPFLGADDPVRTTYAISLMRQAVAVQGMEKPIVATSAYKEVVKYGLRNSTFEATDANTLFKITDKGIGSNNKSTWGVAGDEKVFEVTTAAGLSQPIMEQYKNDMGFYNHYSYLEMSTNNCKSFTNKMIENINSRGRVLTEINPGDKYIMNGDRIAHTNFEIDDSYSFGVNAIALYHTFEGYGFEDSCIVSESFAEKMSAISHTLVKIEDSTKEGIYDILGISEALGTKLEFKADIPLYKQLADFKDEYVEKDNSIKVTLDKKAVMAASENVFKIDEEALERNKSLRSLASKFDEGNASVYASILRKAAESKNKYLVYGKDTHQENDKIRMSQREQIQKKDLGVLIAYNKYVDPDSQKVIHEYLFKHKKKLTRGDKLSDRHGGKTTVSKVVPDIAMPSIKRAAYTNVYKDYTVDIILNQSGIVSRMNVGKMLEGSLGMACKILGLTAVAEPFNSPTINDIREIIDFALTLTNDVPVTFDLKPEINRDKDHRGKYNRLMEWLRSADEVMTSKYGKESWKYNYFRNEMKIEDYFRVMDHSGIFDEELEVAVHRNSRTETEELLSEDRLGVGNIYIFRVKHNSEDKFHFRDTGRRSKTTGQPPRGSANSGGQRIGEMEIVTYLAHGASNVLSELYNRQSDEQSNGRAKSVTQMNHYLDALGIHLDRLSRR